MGGTERDGEEGDLTQQSLCVGTLMRSDDSARTKVILIEFSGSDLSRFD